MNFDILVTIGIFLVFVLISIGAKHMRLYGDRNIETFVSNGSYEVVSDDCRNECFIRFGGHSLIGLIYEEFEIDSWRIDPYFLDYFLNGEYVPPFIFTIETFRNDDFEIYFDFISPSDYDKIMRS